MKRNPNDWVPGFEGEFVGVAGHEKRIHKTHFTIERTLKKAKGGKLEWVEVSPGRYRGIPKETLRADDESEE
jgi:hypothetical protein